MRSGNEVFLEEDMAESERKREERRREGREVSQSLSPSLASEFENRGTEKLVGFTRFMAFCRGWREREILE